jgi:hypothetical protein
MKIFLNLLFIASMCVSSASFAVKCGPTYCRCDTDHVNKHSCKWNGSLTTCNAYCNNT